MAWWVKNHIAVNDDETKQLCSIEADNQTSLPAADQTATAGFIIVRGSDALVLDTGDRYIMNSAGTWVQQPTGVQLDLSGYATTQDLTDGLAAKVDTTTYTAGQAAQDAETNVIANLGAKNLLRDQSLNATSSTGVTITPNGDGTYTLSGTPTGTATYLYTLSSNFTDLLGLEAGKEYTISSGSNKVLIRVDYSLNGTSWETTPLVNNLLESANFTLPDTAVGLYVRFRSTAAAGSLDGIVLKPMIRRAEITDSSYAPYAPTNRELYEAKVTMKQAYGDATAIPANSDLNNYTTPGIYYAVVANVSSMANTPYKSTGLRLVVEKNTLSGVAVFQAIYPTSRTHQEFYRRIYEGGSWSSWYKYEGTQTVTP